MVCFNTKKGTFLAYYDDQGFGDVSFDHAIASSTPNEDFENLHDLVSNAAFSPITRLPLGDVTNLPSQEPDEQDEAVMVGGG